MLLQRDWLASPVDWEGDARAGGLSREDVAVLLARGMPRRFRSLKSHVVRLPPGYALRGVADGARPVPVRTWSALRAGDGYRGYSLQDAASELRVLLMRSVRRYSQGMRVGLLLSGGYDSTLLATLMARDGVDLRCYSVEAPELFPSEWEQAELTAKRLEVPIRKVVVTLRDLLESTAVMRRYKKSPNMCLTTAHLLAACRAAAEDGCDVMVSGTGSDELFGPCAKEAQAVWRFEQRASVIGQERAWSQLLGEASRERTELLYRGCIQPFAEKAVEALLPGLDVGALLEEDVVGLYREVHAEFPLCGYEGLTLQLELELRSADVLLHELETAARAGGMPIAFPFYDQAVVELAAGMPLRLKAHCGRGERGHCGDVSWDSVVTKYVLREAFGDVMPQTAERVSRAVATVPFSWSSKDDLKRLVRERIEGSAVWEQVGVNRGALERLMRDASSERDFWMMPRRFWLLYQVALLDDDGS